MTENEAAQTFDAEEAGRVCDAFSDDYGGAVIDALGEPEAPAEIPAAADEDAARAVLDMAVATRADIRANWPEAGQRMLRSGLAAARQLNEKTHEGTMLNALGSWHLHADQPERALLYYQRALAAYRELDEKTGMAVACANTGMAYHALEQARQAKEHYRHALHLFEELDDAYWKTVILVSLAALYDKGRQYRRAIHYIKRALAIAQGDDRRGKVELAMMLGHASMIYRQAAQHKRALEYAERALAIARETGSAEHIAAFATNLALMLYSIPVLRRRDDALPLLEEAVTLLEEEGLGEDAGGRSLTDLQEWLAAWRTRAEEAASRVHSPGPIQARLTKGSGFPSPRVAVWLAVSLGLATLAVGSAAILLPLDRARPFGVAVSILGPLAWWLHALLPVGTAIVGLSLARSEVRAQTYDLQRLTNLSSGAVFRGYVYGALHRVRLPLALTIGLMPAMVVGALYQTVAFAYGAYSIMPLLAGYLTFYSLPYAYYLAPIILGPASRCTRLSFGLWASLGSPVSCSLAILPMAVGFWGLSLAAAALGVDVGLVIEKRSKPNWFMLLVVVLWATFVRYTSPQLTDTTDPISARVVRAVWTAGLPFFVGFALLLSHDEKSTG